MQNVITSIASTLGARRAVARVSRILTRRRTRTLRAIATLLIVSSSVGNKCAEAQSAANVLLVTNSTSPASEAIGRYYAEHRGVPQDNVCPITPPASESIDRAAYERQIDDPIWQCIASRRAHDRI